MCTATVIFAKCSTHDLLLPLPTFPHPPPPCSPSSLFLILQLLHVLSFLVISSSAPSLLIIIACPHFPSRGLGVLSDKRPLSQESASARWVSHTRGLRGRRVVLLVRPMGAADLTGTPIWSAHTRVRGLPDDPRRLQESLQQGPTRQTSVRCLRLLLDFRLLANLEKEPPKAPQRGHC